MNIAIDGYEANVVNRVGIGTYAFETLKGLHKHIHNKTNIRAHIYLPSNPLDDMPLQSDQWVYRMKKPTQLWTFLGLPLALLTDTNKPSVVFSPTHYIPRFVSFPRVFSIMDLSFMQYPELFRKKDLHQLIHWTRYSVKHSQAIFTISEFSRNAIIETYNYKASNVFVTYPGFRMSDKTVKVSVKEKYGLKNPYVLSVGTLQPRKNFTKLIEAFSLLKMQPAYKDLHLVIVGKKGWLYEEILKAPDQFHISSSVIFLDFVPDDDLSEIYRNAQCFVLASLYEGFGLPVLEAMAYGTSVVVSNVSSLPEIAGDAGILIDPFSVQSIQAGITRALEEKNKKEGQLRLNRGFDRVKLFNWDNAARQTLDILEKVGNGQI